MVGLGYRIFDLSPIGLFAYWDKKATAFFAHRIDFQQIDDFTFITIAALIIILELLLIFSKKSGLPSQLSKWVLRLNIPKLALFSIGLFAAFLPLISNYFQEMASEMSFHRAAGWYSYYALQAFIIYGCYYLYYHIHHHFLFNKLLKEKGLLYYLFGLLALVIILTPVLNQLFAFFPVVYDLKIHTLGLTNSIFDDLNYSIPISVLILSFPLILTIEWYRQINLLNVLEKEKSQAELDLLKQQINPHFFFNTLNNLYAMSLTKEEKTPETILQLSELMRYVIYKGKEKNVKLSEDIKYIRDYIDLQQIRLHKNLSLTFETDIENPDTKIPPLLFIILVENAFKHGIEPAEEKCFLNINLVQKGNSLDFICHNSYEMQGEKAIGIGLENLKHRLDILFPGQYSFSVQKNTADFKASLNIQL